MLNGLPTWLAARRPWQRFALAFLLGALATAAFAPLYALPVLLISFPGLILLLEAAPSRKGAFGVGWFFGFGHFLTGFYWVANALAIAGAPPAAAIALPLGMALYSGLAGLIYRVAGRRVSIAFTGLAAGVLVLLAFEVATLPGAVAAWMLLLFHPRMFRFSHFFKEDPAMSLGVSIFAWLLVRWLLGA